MRSHGIAGPGSNMRIKRICNQCLLCDLRRRRSELVFQLDKEEQSARNYQPAVFTGFRLFGFPWLAYDWEPGLKTPLTCS